MRSSLSAAMLAFVLVAGVTPNATATDPVSGPGPSSVPPAPTVPEPSPSAAEPSTSPDPTPAPSLPAPPDPSVVASPVTPATSPSPPPLSSPDTGSVAPVPSDPVPPSAAPSPADAAGPLSGLPPATPAADPAAPDGGAAVSDLPQRVIVTLRDRDVAGRAGLLGRRLGFRAERLFTRTMRGFSATLRPATIRELRADPAVVSVVPDDRVTVAGVIPDGVRRIFGPSSSAADIDGADDVRVDADVAVIDSGIAPHPDLVVAGGYDCTSADRTAWTDANGHGTHVAGTIGARDGSDGVVGVAPGVRLWAVKVLGADGSGYRSWIICGLDWVASQRDPADPGRPLFEAANMSVAGDGADDGACGTKNADLEHQAICRVTAQGTVVVAAAANDRRNAATRVPAAYDEVITVSALADLDGRPGGAGAAKCWSWGGYDVDDTFADFSNYGSDIDLIAPGKCVWSTLPGGRFGTMSGTSMAAPHVTGAAALYRSTRPDATPAEVREALRYLGNMGWATSTDPDSVHEPLLDISRLGPLGFFSMAAGGIVVGEAGGTRTVAVRLARSATFFEPVDLTLTIPSAVGARLDRTRLFGFAATTANLTVTIPPRLRAGTYPIRVSGRYHGVAASVVVPVVVETDPPTAKPPVASLATGSVLSATAVPFRVAWPAATDPSSGIARYEVRERHDDGAWTLVGGYPSSTLAITRYALPGHAYAWSVRAQDAVGNWSPWVDGAAISSRHVAESSREVRYRGTWTSYAYRYAFGGRARYTTVRGAWTSLSFTGRAVAVVGPKGPTRGWAEVRADGAFVRNVSTYASRGQSRVVLAVVTFPTAGAHTVLVRDLGTSGRPRIDLDAFIVVP